MISIPTTSRLRRLALAAAAIAFLITSAAALTDAPVAEAGPATSKRKAAARSAPAAAPKAKPLDGVVNINLASEKELMKLPGIGPSKARRIVKMREKRGKFRRVRDLRRVKGIGVKTLKKLEPNLTLVGPTTLQ